MGKSCSYFEKVAKSPQIPRKVIGDPKSEQLKCLRT